MGVGATYLRGVSAPASILLGLAVIAAAIGINALLFEQLLGRSYLRWYLEGSALIGILTSITMKLWADAETNVDLISAHPLVYLAACCVLAGVPLFAIGTLLRPRHGERQNLLDLVLALPLLVAIGAALLLWLAVIVPPQYFVYLVCGAPARVAARAPVTTALTADADGRLHVDEKPQGMVSASARNVDLFAKPVAATALVAAGVMFLAKQLVS